MVLVWRWLIKHREKKIWIVMSSTNLIISQPFLKKFLYSTKSEDKSHRDDLLFNNNFFEFLFLTFLHL
jgi:hypothetical protein